MRTEEDLVQTLRTAASQAAHANLADGVARRRARRARQRAGVLLAAAAVVAVAGGMTAILSGTQRQAPPAASPVPGSVAALWPEALVKVPAADADGWKAYPSAAMSGTEVLMIAGSPDREDFRLEVYDSAAGRTRVLGEIPVPNKQYSPHGLEVGADYIAWFGLDQENRDWADFWIMPREGGQARRVGEVSASVDRVGLAGDHLVWSQEQGGVYRMPLTGGTPERLPGSDGLHLSTWPWAYEGGLGANMTRIVNLETGRSSDVALPGGVEMMQCHPQWCAGVQDKSRIVVQRVDGSERTKLPGTFVRSGFQWLYGDRYALFLMNTPDLQQPVLYDLATGTMAALGDAAGPDPLASPPYLLYWDDDVCENRTCNGPGDGNVKEHTVLNLKAVTG